MRRNEGNGAFADGVGGVDGDWGRRGGGVAGGVRERVRVRQGLSWLVGVWVVYLGVLVGVSLRQPRRVVAMGQAQCYDEMCFTVAGVEEVPRYLADSGWAAAGAGDGSGDEQGEEDARVRG